MVCYKDIALNFVRVGACQVGSGAFGEWFWYFWLVVRPIARIFSMFIVLTACNRFLSMSPSRFGIILSRQWFWEGPQQPLPRTSQTTKRQ